MCYLGIQLPPIRGTALPPIFGPCLLWPNGRPSQLLLSTCTSFYHYCTIRQYDRYIIFSVSAVYVGSCSVILVCELNDVIFLTAHCCISDIILIYVRVRTRCFQFSCFTHKCWPDCKPEGPLFSPAFVCLCVCLSVCLSVCVPLTGTSTLQAATLTDFDETWSQGPYSDLIWPRP